jgi:hypothetical protein
MIHDFEEILFIEPWLLRNKQKLKRKFPKLSSKVLAQFEKLSTAGFAMVVAEEFVLLSIITYLSILREQYFLWFGLFMAFSIHLVMHIIQWLIFRSYIPCIVTAVLALPLLYLYI